MEIWPMDRLVAYLEVAFPVVIPSSPKLLKIIVTYLDVTFIIWYPK